MSLNVISCTSSSVSLFGFRYFFLSVPFIHAFISLKYSYFVAESFIDSYIWRHFCIDKCSEWLATFSAALAPEEFLIFFFFCTVFFFYSSRKKNLEALNQTSWLWYKSQQTNLGLEREDTVTISFEQGNEETQQLLNIDFNKTKPQGYRHWMMLETWKHRA